MAERTDDAAGRRKGEVALWLAALAGPAAAFAQVAIGLMLVPAARDQRSKAILYAFSALALATTIAGLAYCSIRLARGNPQSQGLRFIARGGVALDVFAIAVIAAQTVPIWLLALEE
jgi:hypothetical protein